MAFFRLTLLTILLTCDICLCFPNHGSLAGLSARELEQIIPTLEIRALPSPPGPLDNPRAKLVTDPANPWIAPGENDIRGPCPGINTLANHGFLPRNGIASPSQIVTAVQEIFNMANDLAVFLTYGVHLVDGNLLTDLVSIGGKTPATGPDPPSPAIVGGFNTHAVFEGDVSTTRGDAFFGDNHSFNETLFDELTAFSDKFGGGAYNLTVAAEIRFQRIQDSIATNPNFSFISPRYFTAYAESIFPLTFFVDGRETDSLTLNMTVARGFFQDGRLPDDFFRSNISWTLNDIGGGIGEIFAKHPIQPGGNNGTVNSYTVDPNSANLNEFCQLYTDFVNITIRGLYPNATGPLLEALNQNLDFFFSALSESNQGCTQVPAFV